MIGSILKPILQVGMGTIQQSQQRKAKREVVRRTIIEPCLKVQALAIMTSQVTSRQDLVDMVDDVFDVYLSPKGHGLKDSIVLWLYDWWVRQDKINAAVHRIIEPKVLAMHEQYNRCVAQGCDHADKCMARHVSAKVGEQIARDLWYFM